jgi:hypothetical protein
MFMKNFKIKLSLVVFALIPFLLLSSLVSAHLIKKEFIYQGKLGDYQNQVVMHLEVEEDSVTGSYYYSKHQKKLQLKGVLDRSNGMVVLTESYKGVATGYFKGVLFPSKIKGSWSATKNFEDKQKFELDLVNTATSAEIYRQNQFRRYLNTFINRSYDYSTDSYDFYEVSDILNVNFIDKLHFDFYYSVNGSNGHTGGIQGVAKMINKNNAVFISQDGCELKFDFANKNKVVIKATADKCGDYGGANIIFDNTLKLQKKL